MWSKRESDIIKALWRIECLLKARLPAPVVLPDHDPQTGQEVPAPEPSAWEALREAARGALDVLEPEGDFPNTARALRTALARVEGEPGPSPGLHDRLWWRSRALDCAHKMNEQKARAEKAERELAETRKELCSVKHEEALYKRIAGERGEQLVVTHRAFEEVHKERDALREQLSAIMDEALSWGKGYPDQARNAVGQPVSLEPSVASVVEHCGRVLKRERDALRERLAGLREMFEVEGAFVRWLEPCFASIAPKTAALLAEPETKEVKS